MCTTSAPPSVQPNIAGDAIDDANHSASLDQPLAASNQQAQPTETPNQSSPPSDLTTHDHGHLHTHFDLESTVQSCIAYRLKGKTAPLWGFFRHISDDKYSCVICDPGPSTLSATDKRERKGLISYTSAKGTNSLKRHCRSQHADELNLVDAKLKQIDAKGSRPRKKAKLMRKFFATHEKYKEESEQQKKHNRDFVLLIARAALPFSIVDNSYFLNYIHSINPRVNIPSRRKLTQVLIPRFMNETTDQFVTSRLRSLASVTISFDLWMSRGCQDIFDLIVHGLDHSFENHHVHLKMIECNTTTGVALASALEEELKKHDLLSKVIACVKDGGANLSVCTSILKTIASCQPLGLMPSFEGTCFAHILPGACSAALSLHLCSDLDGIDIPKAKSTLQKCITWTKKSGKGREVWYKACRESQMKERLMPTPVKTRFVSTVVMFTMMLKYRSTVELCYSQQRDLKLRERVPSMRVWETIRLAASTLEPVMYACLKMQRRNWMLSDAVGELCNLYLHYERFLTENPAVLQLQDIEGFETQLKLYQHKMAKIIMAKLKFALEPLLQFKNIDEPFVHHYLCLVLDPEFKSLRNPFMKMHKTNVQAGRELAKRYDDEVIIPLLLKLKGLPVRPDVQPGSSSVFSTVVDAAPTSGVDTENVSISNEGSIDCFTEEATESDYEREKRSITSELSRFRSEPFSSSQISKHKWLASKKDQFPTVITLAQHVLGIPPSQIDNERIFSSAGRIATPLRNSIATSQINNLICISQNYPQAHMMHSVAEGVGLEEFSDYFVSIEAQEDESESE